MNRSATRLVSRALGVGISAMLLPALLLVASAHTAHAQITLIPGPQRSVPNGPQFVAAADFDSDGIADAAVTDSISNRITVLLGQADGSFGSAVDFAVSGQSLHGLVAGDLNSNDIPDLAVADYIDGEVFTALGNGDGTFNVPISYEVGSSPVDVAIGNFDGQKGNDLVTADQGSNAVSVLLNLGDNKGFAAHSDYFVGAQPKRVAIADLNGDGVDDIIVINTGTGATDDISVLLNNGLGGFLIAPTNFTVGAGAVDMTIADFNDDGAPDVAVLNSTAIAPNTFSISILINRTIIGPNNRPIGTGSFDVQEGTQITCPTSINLIPISCTPRDIKSADFDGDGFIDLVVSVSTASVDTSGTTSGFITALAGRGDGTFDFATQVLVGLGPREMAIADFNGDGSPDIGLTEFNSNTVRIVRSVAPPPRPNGQSCQLGTQCQSTFCVDHVCCGSSSCPAGQVCNVSGSTGQCSSPAPTSTPTATPTPQATPTATPIPLVVSGTCREPGPQGLVPCTAGTVVTAYVCTDPSCAAATVIALEVTQTDANGQFVFVLGAAQVAGKRLVFDATIVQAGGALTSRGRAAGDTAVDYRIIDFGPVSGQPSLAPMIDPISAAATQLLEQNGGLQNFTDTGIQKVIDAVRTANQNVTFAGQSADIAVILATQTASNAPAVQQAIQSARTCAVGDCNQDGQVTVDKVLTMVNIALGNSALSTCIAGDANGDGEITIDEILLAVINVLNGCADR